MKYSAQEVMQYAKEADVKMIRLAFCDVFGRQKNIVIMPRELERAFSYGIAIDGSAIAGFGGAVRSDLILHPDPTTLTLLPWRPETGKVVRMFCDISYPDGTAFECDTRGILKNAVKAAVKKGYKFTFGPEMEFYLFENDADGKPTKTPYDMAGYMDIAPEDKGENIRREICLMLEEMGILPESSHHEEGPGQNEIDFRYADPVTAADNAVIFKSIVKSVAARNGLTADFMPKPMADKPGSGMHINFAVKSVTGDNCMTSAIAGIIDKIYSITAFLNPCDNSYDRLGGNKAPGYISWSTQNRSQLIRIPAAEGEFVRAELRSPDPESNPYLAFTLLIYAGLDGIEQNMKLPESADINLFSAPKEVLAKYKKLPENLSAAKAAAGKSDFVKTHLPAELIRLYCE
jgi:glutamine synthetase